MSELGFGVWGLWSSSLGIDGFQILIRGLGLGNLGFTVGNVGFWVWDFFMSLANLRLRLRELRVEGT